MTECRTPELQDLLPDFVAESLSDADRVRLTAHLAECDACTADLALLRQVRLATVKTPPIDVAGIVAALPRPAVSAKPVLQVHRGNPTPPTMRASSRPSIFRGSSLLRMAATIGVVLAGGMSLLVARRGTAAFSASPDALQVGASTAADSTAVATESVTESVTVAAVPQESARSASTAASAASHSNVAVSYGALDDVTEQEMQQLLDRLEKWDGATSAEPTPTLPVVTSRGGELP